MFSLLSLSLLSLILADSATATEEQRTYLCRRSTSLISDCRLKFDEDDEWDAINDSGCFQEQDSDSGELVSWCPLQCMHSPFAYAESASSASCHSSSYGVVMRKRDWFLWRTAECAVTDSDFKLSCVSEPNVRRSPPISDPLPDQIDSILRIMFPSYRN